MTDPVNPARDGLTPGCFSRYPAWSKQVLALRLLYLLVGPLGSYMLPRVHRTPLGPPGAGFLPDSSLPPGTVVPPGEVFPDGWTPEDTLPDGVTLTPETSVLPGTPPEDMPAPGTTPSPDVVFPPDWTPEDPLPDGVIVPPVFDVDTPYIPPAELPPELFPPGYNPAWDLPFDLYPWGDIEPPPGVIPPTGTPGPGAFAPPVAPPGFDWTPILTPPGVAPPDKPAYDYYSGYPTYAYAVPISAAYTGIFDFGGSMNSTPNAPIRYSKDILAAETGGLLRTDENTWRDAYDRDLAATPNDPPLNPQNASSVFVTSQFPGPTDHYKIWRNFMSFDLSSIPTTAFIKSATLTCKGHTSADSQVALQQGTHRDPLNKYDFRRWTGPQFDRLTWSLSDNIFTLNASGIFYLNSVVGSTAKFCFRQYENDFLDVDPGPPTFTSQNGCYLWNASSEGDKPVLSLVYYN